MKNTHAYMTPAKIEEISIGLWGKEKWREAFQNFFDLSYSQLHRYMSVYNGQTIPKAIALGLDMAVTLRKNEIALPTLAEYVTPIADVKPVLFVPEKKPKIPRPDNDAPIIDLFGEDEPAAPAEEPEKAETPIEPPKTGEPAPAETKPEPKPARNRSASAPKTKTTPAKKPVAKPKAATKKPAPAATAKDKKPAKSK